MGLLLTLFIIAGIIYLLWPAIRIFHQISNAQRRGQEYWRGFTGSAPGSGQSPHPRSTRRKKIDDNVGEYVDFEEIPGPYTPPTPTPFTPEQQISDADFEEIK